MPGFGTLSALGYYEPARLDFSAFSPEHIDPGNARSGIRNTPKVVGGQTPACTEAATRFYGKLCDQVARAKSAREAEMAKLRSRRVTWASTLD